jgi:hypothetical protein
MRQLFNSILEGLKLFFFVPARPLDDWEYNFLAHIDWLRGFNETGATNTRTMRFYMDLQRYQIDRIGKALENLGYVTISKRPDARVNNPAKLIKWYSITKRGRRALLLQTPAGDPGI